ncbi:MAG: efflux RND transporter periplasmic adaptor subunit, partial [Deltaproteobacteria bacterium]|nr:efflux RND transporter periplasmic adaptor subunit [Deltaproteobacteria bacterium]
MGRAQNDRRERSSRWLILCGIFFIIPLLFGRGPVSRFRPHPGRRLDISKENASMRRGMLSALFFCAVILHNALAWAASEDKAPPPAPVVVEAVEVMDLAPEADFVGTLHFVRNSAMAAEVAGKVREVGVEVGDRVRRGQVLARLNTDLLDKAILALEMEVEEVDTRLELARKLYERHQELFESGNVAEHTFDDSRLATAGLESRLASRRAELAGRMLEREKRTIQADFDGVVLEKGVEVGEWLPVGGLVVRVADNEVLEVEVPLPQRYLPYLSIGAAVQVTVSGNILQGRIRTIIPQADATSRTVPIRIRLQEDNGLAAGTEALVT